jgi:hypothetical protein
MTVIARDGVAADHLVYAWPFPIGPECEVACSEDEQVVMCPAWMVGDRLGPGRHRWRTPDPTRPVAAFFVLTAPVEVNFDMVTGFVIPATGQPVRLRATGSLQVRCADPGLLIAQFVGLPFDSVNEGVLRSVRRSVERMLARLLTRRVVMSGGPAAVTDGGTLTNIVEELIAYNPTAGAVFGVELIRMGYVMVAADDGSTPFLEMPNPEQAYATPPPTNGHGRHAQETQPPPYGNNQYGRAETPSLDTVRGMPAITPDAPPVPTIPEKPSAKAAPSTEKPTQPQPTTASGEIGGTKKPVAAITPETSASASGEIGGNKPRSTLASAAVPPPAAPPARKAAGIAVPKTDSDGNIKAQTPPAGTPAAAKPAPSSIMGIGMGAIGRGQSAHGEISQKIPVGGRVLVPGPNGLMQSATVRQMMSGYYELEIGATGQTVWVPVGGVVPD